MDDQMPRNFIGLSYAVREYSQDPLRLNRRTFGPGNMGHFPDKIKRFCGCTNGYENYCMCFLALIWQKSELFILNQNWHSFGSKPSKYSYFIWSERLCSVQDKCFCFKTFIRKTMSNSDTLGSKYKRSKLSSCFSTQGLKYSQKISS